jgi:hypothetical protein
MTSYRLRLCLALVFASGCSLSDADYRATITAGVKTVPHVNEIQGLFSNCPIDNFITQSAYPEAVTWNTEVPFGGKYVLTYQSAVFVNYRKRNISKTTNAPIFSLVQVSRVSGATSEIVGADFDADYKFSESDWEKVVAAHGDFSVIGIQIDTNHSVPRFDDFIHAIRAGRVWGR